MGGDSLQDWSVRAVDVANRRDRILYAPSKKSYKALAQAHIVLAPHKPWLFFATPISSAINVVLVDELRTSKAARKLRTEHKKPVTALACHPQVENKTKTTLSCETHSVTSPPQCFLVPFGGTGTGPPGRASKESGVSNISRG